jgi:hypothetical protein
MTRCIAYEDAIVVDITGSVEEIVTNIMTQLRARQIIV